MFESFDNPEVTPDIVEGAAAAALTRMWRRLTRSLSHPPNYLRRWYIQGSGDQMQARIVLSATQAGASDFLDAVPDILVSEGFTLDEAEMTGTPDAPVRGATHQWEVEASWDGAILVTVRSAPIAVDALVGAEILRWPAECVPWSNDARVTEFAKGLADLLVLGGQLIEESARNSARAAQKLAEIDEIEDRIDEIYDRSRQSINVLLYTVGSPGVALAILGLGSLFIDIEQEEIAPIGILAGIAIFSGVWFARGIGISVGFAPLLSGAAVTTLGVLAVLWWRPQPLAYIWLGVGVVMVFSTLALIRAEVRRTTRRTAAL